MSRNREGVMAGEFSPTAFLETRLRERVVDSAARWMREGGRVWIALGLRAAVLLRTGVSALQ